jgi:hypothetical protein
MPLVVSQSHKSSSFSSHIPVDGANAFWHILQLMVTKRNRKIPLPFPLNSPSWEQQNCSQLVNLQKKWAVYMSDERRLTKAKGGNDTG